MGSNVFDRNVYYKHVTPEGSYIDIAYAGLKHFPTPHRGDPQTLIEQVLLCAFESLREKIAFFASLATMGCVANRIIDPY